MFIHRWVDEEDVTHTHTHTHMNITCEIYPIKKEEREAPKLQKLQNMQNWKKKNLSLQDEF